MDIEELFEKRKDNPLWNTSYPQSPLDWKKYQVGGKLLFDIDKELSFYIHVPFCKRLCSFCEYTRMVCPDENIQRHYLKVVRNDVATFKKETDGILLYGFDIGGGTPTALSDENFSFLMGIYQESLNDVTLSDDFEPSIEGTFSTLSRQKIKDVVDCGIRRLSLGVQSTNAKVLHSHNRNNDAVERMDDVMQMAWQCGIEKINIDMMYGLGYQDEETIARDLDVLSRLRPQQVTLYELRTNMIGAKNIPAKENLFMQYSLYYQGLISMGYKARFGQNTFSKDENDCGVSSYLRSRMLSGCSYKGFGLSAQSMNSRGVSYNLGKNSSRLKSFLDRESYAEEYTYLLPPKELAAKYIAISGYNASFSLSRLSEIIGFDASKILGCVLDFFQNNGMILLDRDSQVFITRKGFMYYGAILSVFIEEIVSSRNC